MGVGRQKVPIRGWTYFLVVEFPVQVGFRLKIEQAGESPKIWMINI